MNILIGVSTILVWTAHFALAQTHGQVGGQADAQGGIHVPMGQRSQSVDAERSLKDLKFAEEFQRKYSPLHRLAESYEHLHRSLVQAEIDWLEQEYRIGFSRAPKRKSSESADQYLKRLEGAIEEYFEDRGINRIERFKEMFKAVDQTLVAHLEKTETQVAKDLLQGLCQELYRAQRDENPRYRVRAVGRALKSKYVAEAKNLFFAEHQPAALIGRIKAIEVAVDLEQKRLERERSRAHSEFEQAKELIYENRNAEIRAIRGKEVHGGEVYNGIMDDAENANLELERKYHASLKELDEDFDNLEVKVRMRHSQTDLEAAVFSQILEFESSDSDGQFLFANRHIEQILLGNRDCASVYKALL